VAIAICTYQRNEDLAVLLSALVACAERVKVRAAIGVVVIDDTVEGGAQSIARQYTDCFELGLEYKISGRQNISLARNLAIEAAMAMADWTVMTDDDCEPPVAWIEELLSAQAKTAADCVTGRMVRRPPADSPRWLFTEPFLELGVEQPPMG
jgi:GT2 family glycosyltransferase